MCIDPLSATALVLAADHGCGCGRRARRNSGCGCCCGCCDMQRETAVSRAEDRREQEAAARECCENMARQRAEERAQAGCGCGCSRPVSDSCSCGVVRPGATRWSPSRPSRCC